MIIFNMGWNNKYFVPHRIVEPFVLILTGIINLFLLPTPYTCELTTKYLHWILKAQMAKRKLQRNELPKQTD